MELNEIIEQRKAKLEGLKAKGVNPYGKPFAGSVQIGQATAEFLEGKKVAVSGRMTAKRGHGKAMFGDLRDSTGKIQLYMRADVLGPDKFALLDNVETGDFISVNGELFKTHTGEPTVKVEDFTVLAKALRPLPEKWHGLKDIELRYRQRYLDLIANEESRAVFLMRARAVRSLRRTLDESGFLEVETPMMHDIAGGAAGRPFKTFHNEYGMELFLRIAPELYLKRLLVGGLDRVYEINRSYRNEGVSTRHNPEFTMLEVYQAYSDIEGMMRLCERLIINACQELRGALEIEYNGTKVDLTPPWKVVSFAGLVADRFGIQPSDPEKVMLEKLHAKGFARDKDKLTRTQINKIIEDTLEEGMSVNPTFVVDYYTSLSPLAKTRADNPLLSERFELFISGMEVGNAYSELNDPTEQRRRFEEEIAHGEGDGKVVDEEYVTALEHGMPSAGGLGIGVDRLVMLLCDRPSIRDVILFPLLRRTEQKEEAGEREK
jgi:lysyl-tRNA synthetase, class II